MPSPVLDINVEHLGISAEASSAVAEAFAAAYQSRQPYPHGCFDNFLPAEILHRVRNELRQLSEAETSFDRPQERLKRSYNPEKLPHYTRSLFYALNSRPFVLFLEKLSGIRGLIPDPYFSGGGIHVVENGGHLDIHSDFNHHEKLNLERRLNVLIYLNENWLEEWGGSFEIWNTDMTAQAASFTPLFNRMVCFNTTSESWHGNPEPVAHPDGEPRISIALYYYTATWDSARKAHSTLFTPRPGSRDSRDRIEARHRALQNFLPPFLYRRIGHRLRKYGI